MVFCFPAQNVSDIRTFSRCFRDDVVEWLLPEVQLDFFFVGVVCIYVFFSYPKDPGYLNEGVWDLNEKVRVSTPTREGAGPSPKKPDIPLRAQGQQAIFQWYVGMFANVFSANAIYKSICLQPYSWSLRFMEYVS